ncbi:MAG TPA: hypothetical protein PKB01_03110 [Xanthobacteraceae bacterium]|nr:hypothetical protein [Xanthobacteraceae bacterium]
MKRLFPLTAFVLCLTSPVPAQSSDIIKRTEAPKEVLAAITCDHVLDYVTRQPFAGGWLWQLKCPSNHANEVAAQVFSRDREGKDAKLIRFPTPYKGKDTRLEEISNVEVFPATREFNHLFVNPEDDAVCRTEARWIARDPLKPELVFWRETKDCDGKRGWRVLVNRKK